MASAELSRRVEKVVGYPPPSEMGADQRREFHEASSTPAASRSAREMAGGDRRGGAEPAEAASCWQRWLGIVEGRVGARRGSLSSCSSVGRPGASSLRSRWRILTIWRRPPHAQAGIVSVRSGTVLQVSFPHVWQMYSATAGI